MMRAADFARADVSKGHWLRERGPLLAQTIAARRADQRRRRGRDELRLFGLSFFAGLLFTAIYII